MASFTHPRIQTVVCSEEDLASLSDINRSLREQVVSLLLEVAILREHMDARSAGIGAVFYGRGAEPRRGE